MSRPTDFSTTGSLWIGGSLAAAGIVLALGLADGFDRSKLLLCGFFVGGSLVGLGNRWWANRHRPWAKRFGRPPSD